MGTWGPGAFDNDYALDWVASLVDEQLMPTIDGFLQHPQIDGDFDFAVAAVSVLNAIMRESGTRPWRDDDVLDGKPVRAAFLKCFDEQIDGLKPQPGFKEEKRAALVALLDEMVRLLDEG